MVRRTTGRENIGDGLLKIYGEIRRGKSKFNGIVRVTRGALTFAYVVKNNIIINAPCFPQTVWRNIGKDIDTINLRNADSIEWLTYDLKFVAAVVQDEAI